jgi:hypothetical protein
MVELIPAQIEDTIILNVSKHCGNTRTDCKDCCDVGVAVHNWLISTELQYVVIDLQDVKDVCRTFVEEIVQLRKRLRIPFLFCGVMERPLKVLQDYSYTTTAYPVFLLPEEAISYMRSNFPLLLNSDLDRVRLNEVLQVARPRNASRQDGGDEADEEAGDLED